MRTAKLVVAMLTMIAVLLSATPISAQAAPPPRTWTKVYTEDQLANANLSIGVIKWNDSLVKGQITVTPNRNDDKYTVKLEEYYQMNDIIWPIRVLSITLFFAAINTSSYTRFFV